MAEDPYWLSLGHYKKIKLSFSDYRSRVDDKNFFLSEEGRTNPEAELLATLDAGLNDYSGDSNEDPLCRFPARYRWLDQQLKLSIYINRHPDCSDYKKWREMIDADSVVLVYASAHLNSPSSMYGHTLLRIDPKGFEKDKAVLLSWAVSFGANIPSGENDILYAYKGIFGGYPGLFNVLPYLDKLKEYSRIENRDLWEYQLNLNPQEVDLLMAHLWELKNINFDYFFFDENCSYQLLSLLDIARPGQHVTEDYPTVVIPVDTVRGVIARGFVSNVVYRPSASTKLEQKIANLPLPEQKVAVELSRNSTILQSPEYLAYSDTEKLKVADAAYDYTRYKYRKSAADEQIIQGSYRLLQEINSLPKVDLPAPETPFHPENGHESGAMTFSAGHADGENYAEFEVRPSFHDLQDNLNGYMPGSAINMGKIKFRDYDSGSIKLQQLDIIDINSLSPRDEFFDPVSWRSSLGFDRERTYGRDELTEQVNGGGGVTYQLSTHVLGYGLLTARAEYNEGFEHNWQLAGGFAGGFLFYSSVGTASIGVDGYEFLNGYHRDKVFALYNWALAKDIGLQFSASHFELTDERYNDFEISMRKFFR